MAAVRISSAAALSWTSSEAVRGQCLEKVLFQALAWPESGHTICCVSAFLLCRALGTYKIHYVRWRCWSYTTSSKHYTNMWYTKLCHMVGVFWLVGWLFLLLFLFFLFLFVFLSFNHQRVCRPVCRAKHWGPLSWSLYVSSGLRLPQKKLFA